MNSVQLIKWFLLVDGRRFKKAEGKDAKAFDCRAETKLAYDPKPPIVWLPTWFDRYGGRLSQYDV